MLPLRSPRRPAALAVLVALAGALPLAPAPGAARAQDGAAPAPPVTVAADWRVVVDPDAGVALRLPPGHDLARADGIWYVHGWYEGGPLLPDMSVEFLPGLAPEEAVARDFPAGAEAAPIALGPATRGLRVTAGYEARDGTPYESTSYLAEAPGGSYAIRRYESFDWPPFDAVARSFHLVEVVDGARPER